MPPAPPEHGTGNVRQGVVTPEHLLEAAAYLRDYRGHLPAEVDTLSEFILSNPPVACRDGLDWLALARIVVWFVDGYEDRTYEDAYGEVEVYNPRWDVIASIREELGVDVVPHLDGMRAYLAEIEAQC
jgi:hypothetical protein